MSTTTGHRDQKQLINLFPLHPENPVEQDKIDEEHSMARIFSSCDDGAATTLTGILCSDDDDVQEEENTNNPSPSSVNYADEEVELVRTAMRRNKTDGNHDSEKSVCYSESSTTASCNHHHIHHHHHNNNNDLDHHRRKLVLKLDYEKIMKSWVNKGPLFIRGNSDVDAPQPQTVPDLQDDDIFLHSSNNMTRNDDQENGGSWMVPEIAHRDDGRESSAMAHNREASVQRYKHKRRNRLFAKTVRYEVRKINAQKRPRIKGRFVKSS
ncbi:hypothetical protein E3N88_01833 [Mikania micrantha]|uniref:CCT domain-containing protein n=1 Tax=Mikania micrantha TaxID=192012 RepID=A0A5N6Q3W7_9ASTR|nr:hypothetical protein E3N88_01833 [Mikania micrantha]